jgi:hypothetical protein
MGKIRLVPLLLGLVLTWLMVSCSSNNSPAAATESTSTLPPADPFLGNGNTGNIANPLTGSSGTTGAIKHFQPALAVRGMACVSCHATINANVITDFGYGDSWYLGQVVPDWASLPASTIAFGSDSQQTQYDPFTWQSQDKVTGQITVPVATMPGSVVATTEVGASASAPAMDLAAYLMLPNIYNLSASWTDSSASTLSFTRSVNAGSNAAGNPLPAVVEQNSVYIGAPSAAQILALAGTNPPSSGSVQVAGSSTPGLSGLVAVKGANGTPYITNSPGATIQCVNQDIVVNGTLFLNSLTLHATEGGCRFYVTGPVFIQGAIQYIINADESSDTSSNIQISSATAIIMGVGLYNPSGKSGTGPDPLHDRLIDDNRNAVFRGAPTNAEYLTWANSVYEEGVNIGSANLIDAANISGYPGYATALSEDGETRVSIPFSHLFMNAPVIHSRYLGVVSGVFVSEILIASLGEFYYNYDSVFNSSEVPILPLLTQDILCVGASSSSCNPISRP